MSEQAPKGLTGWLLVYLLTTVPLLIVWAMGLSGWFFDYPVALMVVLFLLFATPLLLAVLESAKAPRWNIAMLWIGAILITLRSISVLLYQAPTSGRELGAAVAALSGIVALSLGWAIVWTSYFRRSRRVTNTFS